MLKQQAERIRVRYAYDLVTAVTRGGEVLWASGDAAVPHGGSLVRSLMGDAAAAGSLFAVLEPGVPRSWMQGELNLSVIRLAAGPAEEVALCLFDFRGAGVERIVRLEEQAEAIARELDPA